MSNAIVLRETERGWNVVKIIRPQELGNGEFEIGDWFFQLFHDERPHELSLFLRPRKVSDQPLCSLSAGEVYNIKGADGEEYRLLHLSRMIAKIAFK